MANLSLRLDAILSQLRPCELLADIGTDHALVPVAAVNRGLARRALGVDLRSAPLKAAEERLRARGQLSGIELLQSDGLAALGGLNIDALVLAGMSARQMIRILAAELALVRSTKQVIVQPNTELLHLRKWAFESELHLESETLTKESGRYFITLSLAPGCGTDPLYENCLLERDEAYQLGPLLVQSKNQEVREYFEMQRERLRRLVAQGIEQHATELAAFEKALRLMRELRTQCD